MSDLSQAFLDALETGLPLSIAFLGVWLMFRVLHDFDLTPDGSLVLGAAIFSSSILAGRGPWVAVVLASVGGVLAGLLTYALIRLLKLTMILASIIVSIGLFTVNLRILRAPNVSVIGEETLLSLWQRTLGNDVDFQLASISLFFPIVFVVFLLIHLFLKTEFGLALRAYGANSQMGPSLGMRPAVMTIVGLGVANGLVGLSGALVTQQNGFADVNSGFGTVVFGITAVLVGETLLFKRPAASLVVAVVLGTIAYRTIVALAFRAGLQPQDFKGVTAGIVVLALLATRLKSPPWLTARLTKGAGYVGRAASLGESKR